MDTMKHRCGLLLAALMTGALCLPAQAGPGKGPFCSIQRASQSGFRTGEIQAAAAAHETAAEHHKTAAKHHREGNHEKAKVHATEAERASASAHEKSKEATEHSQ